MLVSWAKKSGFCESDFHHFEIWNVLSSLSYCVAAVALWGHICLNYRKILSKRDGILLAGIPVVLLLLGIFSALFHGQLYKIWGKADCALILQVCLYTQTYLSLRIFANRRNIQVLSAYLAASFLLFFSYLLNTLSFSFGFGLVFTYMVGTNVALIAVLLLALWLLSENPKIWLQQIHLLILSLFLFLYASLFWYLFDKKCKKSSDQLGHPLWHICSAAALYLFFLFLLRVRQKK